jgi:hypothetical protein
MDLKDGTQFECGGCSKFGLFSGIAGGCTNGRFNHSGWEKDICVSCNDFRDNKTAWPLEMRKEYADRLALFHKGRGDRLARGELGGRSGWPEIGDPDALFNQKNFHVDCGAALNTSCAAQRTSLEKCTACARQNLAFLRRGGCDDDMISRWCAAPKVVAHGALGGFTDNPSTGSVVFRKSGIRSEGGGKRKRRKTNRKKTKRKKTKRKKTKRKKTNK